jgi:glycosyltransferase involved in cell wall biosynthesis
MDGLLVGIVVPALNEAGTIAGVVTEIARQGTCFVVDDGSTDATAELARAAGAIVVRHPKNLGYDAALDSGFRQAAQAGCQRIITLDADGQHDPDLVNVFLSKLETADVVLGVRHRRARLAEDVFSWYTRYRWGILDPLCGLKGYRTDVYLALGHFDSYGSIGTELMLFAASSGRIVDQVPFKVRERPGQPRFGRRLAANLKIFRALLLSSWLLPRKASRC